MRIFLKLLILLGVLGVAFIIFTPQVWAKTIDLTWNTGAADFEIWESSSLTWATGTLVCSASLTDASTTVVDCTPGTIDSDTTYRVQVILQSYSSSTAAIDWKETTEYVAHLNVHSWAGTGASVSSTCDYNDFGTDDMGPSCSASFVDEDSDTSSDDVRLSNPDASAQNHVELGIGGTEGFMYLITTGTTADDSTNYWLTTDASDPEDSSKISITGAAVSTVSCTSTPATTTFGVLDTGSINTSSPDATTTMSCTHGGGCTLTIQDAYAGLYQAAHTITSTDATPLIAESEGYGVQATTTGAGNGGTLTLNSKYALWETDNVGGLETSAITLASSTEPITNKEVVVRHRATISATTTPGSYVDQITYSCTGN